MISFLAATYGTVSDIEILWTAIAVVGAFFSQYNLRESIKDRAALKAIDQPNGRLMVANTAVKSEGSRLVMQLIFMAIGVMAMFIAGAPDQLQQASMGKQCLDQ